MPEVMCAHANVIAQPVVEALVKQNFAWRASAMSSRRVLRSLHSALTHVSGRVIFLVLFFAQRTRNIKTVSSDSFASGLS